MDCIFCKIVAGEAPCRKIFEDEHTLAFLDISGDADGHTLIVPKAHFRSLLDCDGEALHHMMDTVKKLSAHYTDSCGYEGVNLLNASGACAGQSVPHFHVHLIPRKENDGIDAWPEFPGARTGPDEIHRCLTMLP